MLLSVGAKYIRLSWYIFLANISSAVSFRLSFALQIFGYLVWLGGQFFIWCVFFNQFPSVGGWTTREFLVVYSLYCFSISFLDVFAGGVMDLAEIINAGNLDYFLVFPKSVLWHVAVSKSDVCTIGGIFLSLAMFTFSGSIEVTQLLLFLLAACFSAIMIFNFLVITQSIAFFVGGFDRGASFVRHLLAIASPYPFAIFPSPFKYILMTLLPTFFVVTLPAALVTQFSWTTVAILLGACIVSSLLARFVFTKGLQRYESGNLMSLRL